MPNLEINLGVLLKKRKYEEAELVYKEVERNDDKSLFAIAQNEFGNSI